VRAYSTRDFYAKTMAVLGLGALAGVGALVDGWPGAVDAPRVTPAGLFAEATRVRPTLVVATDATPALAPALRLAVPADSRGIVRAPVELAAYEPAPLTVAASMLGEEESPALAAAEPVPMFDVRDAGPVRWTNVELALAQPQASLSVADRKPAGDGVITTAFKKTGTSLATAGKKTGVKAIDAARAVGSAFRKAFPL
jgi:hypothetical protein